MAVRYAQLDLMESNKVQALEQQTGRASTCARNEFQLGSPHTRPGCDNILGDLMRRFLTNWSKSGMCGRLRMTGVAPVSF